MSITDITYRPFAFQHYMRDLPELAKVNHIMTLGKVDSKAEEYASQAWNSAVRSPSIGIGSIIDTVA